MASVETVEDFICRKEKQFIEDLNKDKFVPCKDISRKGVHKFKREAWIFLKQHNLPEKVFVFERLKRDHIDGKTIHKNAKEGDVEYRIGYFIVGKNGRMKDKWTWGQFCPIIPPEDFKELIKEAKRKKVII